MIYMGKTYRKFTTIELIAYTKAFNFTRKLTQLHVHHTWSPNVSDFKGNNYDAINWGMENYHVNTNGWSTIAQQLTLFPDGIWLLGRDFNQTPASILGWNTGAFCIEMVGNFDAGYNAFKSPQNQAMYEFCEFMVEQKGLQMRFHRDSPTSYKTCPGTGIDRASFFNEVANFTEKKLALIVSNKAEQDRLAELAKAKIRTEELRKIMETARILFKDMIVGTPEKPIVHWTNDYVNYLADKKIVAGAKNSDGTFSYSPDKPLTRGEMACMLAKAMESIEETIHAVVKPFDGNLNDSKLD
jgi:hypothetical protein